MSDGTPTGTLARIKYSITNLWEDYGQQERIGIGLAVNLLLTTLGVMVFVMADGWVAFIGAVWAILHILAIAKWVFGL